MNEYLYIFEFVLLLTCNKMGVWFFIMWPSCSRFVAANQTARSR